MFLKKTLQQVVNLIIDQCAEPVTDSLSLLLSAPGGAAGGLLSWLMTRGKFKSLPQILMELPQAEKQKLYDNVVAVLDNLTWKNAAQLDEVVMGNADLRERVTDVLQNYIKKNV